MRTRSIQRQKQIRAALLLAAAVAAPTAWASTDTWVAGTNEWWANATHFDPGTMTNIPNWSDGSVPGPSSDVSIQSPYIVNYDSTAANTNVNSVAIGLGGLLSGVNANLKVNGSITVGSSGMGTFNLSGGTTLANMLVVGNDSGSTGTCNVSNGASLQITNTVVIGQSGIGVLNINNGSVNLLSSNLQLGTILGSGTINLSSGLLSTTAGHSQTIAVYGNATFNQSGGVNKLNGGTLVVGGGLGGTGIYNLSGGTVNAGNILLGGRSGISFGTGSLFVTGGTAIGSSITTYNPNSLLTVNGGEVDVPIISYAGTSSLLTVNGGTLNSGTLAIHTWNRLNLISGEVGLNGNNTNTGALTIGTGTGTSQATLALSGNAAINTTDQIVGQFGKGIVNHISGTNSTNNLYLGNSPTATGIYSMSNSAVLTVSATATIGNTGIGIFNITGGEATINNYLLLGVGNGTGTLNISGGNLTTNTDEEIGYTGVGTVNQSAGFHSIINGIMNIGVGNRGTYNLSGGVLSISGIGYGAVVGNTATGVFNQTGGTHLSDVLAIGYDTGGTGTYNLSGTGNLFVSNNMYVGFNSGNGVLNQSNGQIDLQGSDLYVGSYFGNGTVNLSGGTLSALFGQEYIGYHGNGSFTQSGGNHYCYSGSMSLGTFAGDVGTYTMTGGTLYVGSLNVRNSTSMFMMTGGTVNTYELVLTDWNRLNFIGGSINVLAAVANNPGTCVIGTPTSSASLSLANGYFHATRILNNGTISLNQVNSEFDDSLINSGTINIANGSFMSGSNLTNNGTLFITSSSASVYNLSGTGTVNIGGTASAVLVTANSTVGGSVNINNLGSLFLYANGTNVSPAFSKSHSIRNVNIATGTSNGGLVDIGNNYLYVDNTSTPFSVVQQYVANAGNLSGSNNAHKGVVNDFSARGGITSSVARNSVIQGDYKYGIGVLDGNMLDSMGFVANRIPTGPLNNGNASNSTHFPGGAPFAAVPTNRVLIAPMLYGDFNGDGRVNDTDIFVFISLGQYGIGPSSYGWVGGDLNGDGKVDDSDIFIFISIGNYQSASYTAINTQAIQHSAVRKAANASTTLTGTTGKLSYVYDAATGDLKLKYNRDTRITANNPLQMLSIATQNGLQLNTDAITTSGFYLTNYSSTTLFAANLSQQIPDGYDLGNILPTGLPLSTLLSDLQLQFNTQGGGLEWQSADLSSSVPEPGSLSLLGLGALLAMRRRRTGSVSRVLSEES